MTEQDEADNARADYLDAEQPHLRALLVKALAALEPMAKARYLGGNAFNRADLSDDDFRLARATAAEIREGLGK